MRSSENDVPLYCLPFAGGSRYSLQALQPYLDCNISFLGLELPGHGSRMREPLLDDLVLLARDLFRQVQPLTGRPYLIYGHSMGGMLGCLLLRELQRYGQPMPRRFFVSGCIAPQFNAQRTIRHTLPNAEFERELVRLGGMPREILEQHELLQPFLPIIRADFRAVETYEYDRAPLHAVPITALKGSQEEISEEQLLGWQAETRAPVETCTMEGNHFFIFDHLAEIAAMINRQASSMRPTRGAVAGPRRFVYPRG